MGGLEIIGPAAGTVVLAVTGCTAPILTLGEVFVEVVVEVVGGAATAMEGLVSESCRESLERSALVLDDCLVCCGDDSTDSVTTEEDPPWLLFDELGEASAFTGTF